MRTTVYQNSLKVKLIFACCVMVFFQKLDIPLMTATSFGRALEIRRSTIINYQYKSLILGITMVLSFLLEIKTLIE